MPLDPSIPLSAKPIDIAGSINQWGNLGLLKNQLIESNETLPARIAGTQAQSQIAQQTAATGAINLQEKQGVQGVLSKITDYQDPQGNIDWNKLLPDVMKVAPTTGSEVVKQMFATQQQAALAKQAVNSLDEQGRTQVSSMLYSLRGQSPEKIAGSMQGLMQQYPTLGPAVSFMDRHILGNAKTQPEIDAALDRAGRMVQTPPTQQGMLTPTPLTVTTPTEQQVINIKPGAQTPTGGKIATSLTAPQQAAIQGTVEGMSKHFEGLQDQATGSALQQGLTGNIQALAKAAAVGTEAEKQNYMIGLLNALGFKDAASKSYQENYALLEKQIAQLGTTTPASTDAKQTLLMAARPNTHMPEGAIKEAAQQVASQIEMNMRIRNKLMPLRYANGGTGDPTAYQQSRQQLEAIADPRAIQYERIKGTPEAKTFLQSLTPQDRQKLGENYTALKAMGMVQ